MSSNYLKLTKFIALSTQKLIKESVGVIVKYTCGERVPKNYLYRVNLFRESINRKMTNLNLNYNQVIEIESYFRKIETYDNTKFSCRLKLSEEFKKYIEFEDVIESYRDIIDILKELTSIGDKHLIENDF